MLRKSLYPQVENLLNRIAGFLNNQGLSPDQLTLAGLALSFVAGWIYATGNLFLGGIVLILGSLGDLLDGPLARLSGRASKFGAFLDSTLDRYSDFFLFGGMAIHFARHDQGGWLLVTLGILLGTFTTSYAKARAEGLGEKCDVGIFERAERVILLILGSFISPLLPVVLWILLLGTNATAIHRILYIRKTLAERS